MCGDILPVCMSAHHVHLVPVEATKSIRSLGTGATDCCELSYRCWDLKKSPLEEQLALLSAGSSLQSSSRNFKSKPCISQPNY